MKTAALALCATAAIATAACGSSSKSTSTTAAPPASSAASPAASAPQPAGASRLTIGADPSGMLRFTPSQATARAGQVTIAFHNAASTPHGLSLEGKNVDREGKIVSQGATTTLSVQLRPGRYTFYCPVPGHRQAGMQGTLTVQ